MDGDTSYENNHNVLMGARVQSKREQTAIPAVTNRVIGVHAADTNECVSSPRLNLTLHEDMPLYRGINSSIDRHLSVNTLPTGHQLSVSTSIVSQTTCCPTSCRRSRASVSPLSLSKFGSSSCPAVICLVLLICSSCIAAPAVDKRTRRQARDSMDSMTYLQTFGYLPQSDQETGLLRTPEELRRSIMNLQSMAHLPQTGVFDNATKALLKKPRCGMRDVGLDDNYTGRRGKRAIGPSKWDHKQITFRILSYSSTSRLTQAEQRQWLIDAFHLWMAVTQLTFHEVMQGDADMLIRFARFSHGDGYPFDGLGLVLAHAFFPGDDLGGDVHFDDDEQWTQYSEEGTNLYIVAAHEIGHALGLRHSNVLGALMYPWYAGYTDNLQLHSDDIQSIQYLYGTKAPGPTQPSFTLPAMPSTTVRTVTQPPRRTPPPPTLPGGVPDPCKEGFDALSVIRTEMYAFKGKWFWRFDDNGLMYGFPVELGRFWYGLPEYVQKVDAVYERESDGKILFFSGNRYWLFASNVLEAAFPADGKPLTFLGFPSYVDHVDAAFIWGHNQMTYFISGDLYWRYNEEGEYMEHNYPRGMNMWRGVPVPVDGAFQHWDGRTYFFNGNQFYMFNDALMKVRKGYPQPIGAKWLTCEYQVVPPVDEDATETQDVDQDHQVDVSTITPPGGGAERSSLAFSVICIFTLVSSALTW